MDLPRRLYHGPEVERLYRDLLAADAGGAATPLSYGSPTGLVYGGVNSDGVSTDVARADHRHALALPPKSTVWDGRVFPIEAPLPHAHSDQFLTGSLDAAWLDWDHDGYITHTVQSPPNSLISTGTGNGTFRMGGRYKAIPSSEFQFIAYCAHDCLLGGTAGTSGLGVGLVLLQDGANSSGDAVALEFSDNAPTTGSAFRLIQQRVSTAYNNVGTVITTPTKNNGIWLRMRALVGGASTDITCDWSYDGKFWQTCSGGPISVGYAVQHYGLMAECNTSLDFRTTHSYFRVWSGTGAYGHNFALNGGYI